jgi:hypothetical protein
VPERRTLRTRIRDPVILAAACRRLGLALPVESKITLVGGPASGRAVLLGKPPVPVVIHLDSGVVSWQDSDGSDEELFLELCRLLQAYACERAQAEADRRGLSLQDQRQDDGSVLIRLVPKTDHSSEETQ